MGHTARCVLELGDLAFHLGGEKPSRSWGGSLDPTPMPQPRYGRVFSISSAKAGHRSGGVSENHLPGAGLGAQGGETEARSLSFHGAEGGMLQNHPGAGQPERGGGGGRRNRDQAPAWLFLPSLLVQLSAEHSPLMDDDLRCAAASRSSDKGRLCH